MSAGIITTFSSEAAGTKREGDVKGKLGGKIIKNLEAAFEAIKNFAAGLPAKAIGLLAKACLQNVQQGPKLQSAPFAVPLHMMVPAPGGSGATAPPRRVVKSKTKADEEE
jgi:hypothetical protein